MDAVINTKQGSKSLHVCKDGTIDNTAWVAIYEEAFPAGQRQDLNELIQQLRDGRMELDETRDEHDNILCMTITEVFRHPPVLPTFLLACYTAVVPEMRGLGIGSIHRSRLDSLLKDEYPDYVGIVSEIESTFEHGVAEDAMAVRVKRKKFFMKLGLQPLDIDYFFPSYVIGEAPIPGELLWVPFSDEKLSEEQLIGMVTRIYTEGYQLPADHPLISQVVASIGRKP